MSVEGNKEGKRYILLQKIEENQLEGGGKRLIMNGNPSLKT